MQTCRTIGVDSAAIFLHDPLRDEALAYGDALIAAGNAATVVEYHGLAHGFISMAGGLYLQGFGGNEAAAGGLAYVMGWTGGFCLVALLIAPHLRRLNLYTVPDYFGVRFGGRWPRHG